MRMKKHFIIGIDEAGRWPWAGPVVAGGFMCPVDFDFSVFAPYLDDSKKMTEKEREEVFARIEKVMEANICRYHFAYREAHDIDTLGIREANRQSMEEVLLWLLQYIDPDADISVYIDGCDNYQFDVGTFEYVFAKKRKKSTKNEDDNFCHPVGISFSWMHENTVYSFSKDDFERDSSFLGMTKQNNKISYCVHGDALIPAISAASVVAKVTRDRMMCDFHEDFSEYGFDTHKGYGTRKHHDALINYGISPIHRKSYAPVKSLISAPSSL